MSCAPWIPRAGRSTSCSRSRWRLGNIWDLLKVILRQLVLRWGNRELGLRSTWCSNWGRRDGLDSSRFRCGDFGFLRRNFDRLLDLLGFSGPRARSVVAQLDAKITYFSATGSGAFFGVGAGAKMLAQLFLTPSGITLEVTWAATAAVALAAPVAADAQPS